ncbi:MAG: Hsp20/alpha crystallin family protein [Candidatus Omnitrophica bacterium]|nr:Hsp20/alpha crystallin family protein [Candidatus Omnitrophota bacterium]
MAERKRRVWDSLWDMERYIDHMRNSFEAVPFPNLTNRLPADIGETNVDIIVTVDIPGVEKSDINIKATPNRIEISAEAKEEKHEEGKAFYRRERRERHFYRTLTLPTEVLVDDARAKYRNGILTIILPKKEVKKAKNLEVE